MNQLKSLHAFMKVVEVGSFAEAARQMGESKSVVTTRVNQLEEHLKLQLLQRSTRRLSITDTGSALYEHCALILPQLDEALMEVSSIEWGLSGTFRVSCVSGFAARRLARDVSEFQLEHPNLQIDLQQIDRVCDPVQEGFDVCLQPRAPNSSVVDAIDVVPIRHVIVASPNYISCHGEPLRPEDLAEHRIVHNSGVEPNYSMNFQDGQKKIQVSFTPTMLTNMGWQLRAAVLWGDCIARVPAYFIEKELISGEVVPLLKNQRIQSMTLSAYFRKSSFIPMKTRIFLNFLRLRYGEFPPWERRILERKPELSMQLGPRNEEC